MIKNILATGILAAVAVGAHAQSSIGLQNYVATSNVALPTLGGLGLEASAVTYARDRGTLFIAGDEGLGVMEVTLSGQLVGSMSFSGWPAASSNNDAEGLAYLGNGVLVVGEERLQDLYRFSYVAGGSVNLANADFVSIGSTVGNVGTEGIAVDPRTGRFVSVKQASPQQVLEGAVTFASPAVGGGTSGMTSLFDPALLGLASLSDVATLGGVDALSAAPAANNLLILSLDSRRLVEVTRSGAVLSSLDLSSLTAQAIEGVTIDALGNLYLVAEDSGTPASRLIVLSAVPEAGTWATMALGLAVLGWRAGRQRRGAGSARSGV